MIDLVTFTGVDTAASFRDINLLAKKYPRAEFGVLVGTHTSEADYGIFPPMIVVHALKTLGQMEGINTAIHLCGKYARAVMEPNDGINLPYLCQGFGRVQVNLHGDLWPEKHLKVTASAVKAFADTPGIPPVILQHRHPWRYVPVIHPKVEYLFDISEGGGIESFDHWPAPEPGLLGRVGYAGGIGPDNIYKALSFAAAYPDAKMWFDMEGRIRTNGLFDLDKVEQVLAQVWREA